MAYVGVVGPGEATAAEIAVAEELGARLVDLGATVVCGGLGGVMEAACRGAKSRRGTTVGLLPGLDRVRCQRLGRRCDRHRASASFATG